MSQSSVHRDRILAALLLVLAGGLYAESSNIQAFGSGIGVVDATFFPKFVSFLIAGLALLIGWQACRVPKARGGSSTPGSDIARVALFAALLFASVLSIPHVGFEVVSVIFLCVSMPLLGMRNIPVMLLVAFGLISLIYVLFVKLMFVPLPSVFTL